MFSATLGLKDWSIMELLLWTPFYIYIHSCGCLDRKRGGAVVLYVEAACEVQLGPTNCQWLLWPHPQSTRPLRSSPKYFTFRLQTQSPNISFSFHFAQFPVKSFTWNNSIPAPKQPKSPRIVFLNLDFHQNLASNLSRGAHRPNCPQICFLSQELPLNLLLFGLRRRSRPNCPWKCSKLLNIKTSQIEMYNSTNAFKLFQYICFFFLSKKIYRVRQIFLFSIVANFEFSVFSAVIKNGFPQTTIRSSL